MASNTKNATGRDIAHLFGGRRRGKASCELLERTE